MPEFVEHEQLQEQPLQELQLARMAYIAKECTLDEYVRCLDRINALVVRAWFLANTRLGRIRVTVHRLRCQKRRAQAQTSTHLAVQPFLTTGLLASARCELVPRRSS